MPKDSRNRPQTAHERVCLQQLRFLPPLAAVKRTRYKTRRQFADSHRADAAKLAAYITFPRRNYLRPRGDWFLAMAPAHWYKMSAINPEARIRFEAIVRRHLLHRPELRQGPLFFVTLTPSAYVFPLATAASVNSVALQRLSGEALRGCSFVGMVEAALFKGWGPQGIRDLDNHVGWHTHNLVWGSTREEIEAAVSRIAGAHTNISGLSAAHIMEIKPEELSIYLRYPLKAPLKEYRLRRSKYVTFDRETGEILNHVRQQKRDMRTGDRLRISAVMRDMYLDQLFFGQGAGLPLARAIRCEALAEFNRREQEAVARQEFNQRQKELRRRDKLKR